MFTRVSSWIHVYITFERCLCIAIPLKIKSMVTPAVSVTSMALIYLLLMLTILPMYLSAHIEWTTNPATNTSRYTRVYNADGHYLESIGLSLSFAVIISSYFLEVICTLIIIRQLREKRKWRNETSGVVVPGSENRISTRDRKVIKMVMVVSSLFIVCSFPGCVHYIVGIVGSEHYNPVVSPNLFFLVSSAVETCEQITYATNIFIFYQMSSRYKLVFSQFFTKAISHGVFVQGSSAVIE
ncbi:uncharacterized protein LOC131944752 [Physella acuta]|uniref:uncharacterized protein LOC131944752 n=1 Tax=Physella acuta TaxID=109671 RepID=UPI0027DAE880|nr:uncharacterized protein LOC131944752 [Physella acuta]